VLVTGRDLPLLERDFDRLDLFDCIVAENGALMYRPSTREERLLTEPADERLAALLVERGVQPLAVGRGIIATWTPHDSTVLAAIQELGLELQIIFNKGAVMVLPTGVSKASGLTAALTELGLSAHNAIGVGDAENDHAFLSLCEVSAAVSNALPALKERADLVLERDHGAGVAELIDKVLEDDLRSAEAAMPRQAIEIGHAGEEPVSLPSPRARVLFTGPSGSGKSTLVLAFLETLHERAFQFALVDPEGDYEHVAQGVVLGRADRAPAVEEVEQVLADPSQSVVVNLLGKSLAERPAFFDTLFARLQELRVKQGRPHWLILDEAHHLLPSTWHPTPDTLPGNIEGLVAVTVHADQVSSVILEAIDHVVLIGQEPQATIEAVAKAAGVTAPSGVPPELEGDEGLLWDLGAARSGSGAGTPVRFTLNQPRQERRRHRRKYAEGELKPDRSFYFRGPDGKLNLRAQNLVLFNQIAEGVDDETWLHHLRQGDYSGWIRDVVKDEELAAEVAAVEEDRDAKAGESRERIRAAIEARYTVPA
jgi:hydroxymethylpyrimidine pyrophosphatase-like HAD family hydrolase/energy-coupling factor transporter ATP-binding protein EcfA2